MVSSGQRDNYAVKQNKNITIKANKKKLSDGSEAAAPSHGLSMIEACSKYSWCGTRCGRM